MNDKNTKTGSAFPHSVDLGDNGVIIHHGLTKREYFAVMAMNGLLAQGIPGPHNMPSALIPDAVRHADLLIEELNKQ